MKKNYFLILLCAISTSLFAVNTTVYVDQNNVLASDNNVGTDASSPWLTLNPAKWTNDMSIIIANGTYTIATKIAIPTTNVTLIGASRTGVILQAMDDATFTAGTTGNTLFQLSGKAATFSTMTIKNVRDNTLKLGGGFDIINGGSLTLTDVTLTKLITAQGGWSGGGAIMLRGGTFAADNCTFEACQSDMGGAIMTFTNSGINPNVLNITNTRFINNSNPKEAFFTTDHFGGAIVFSGKGTFNLDKCYFEGNSSRVKTDNSGTAQGGAIMVRLDPGATSNLNIKNSVFYNNQSDKHGSVLQIGSNGVDVNAVFNLNLTNNVLFQNQGGMVSGNWGLTLNLNKNNVNFQGLYVIANNTFYKNDITTLSQKYSVYVDGMPFGVYFINNLMNDNEGGGNYGLGSVAPAITNSATLRRFKGNIFNGIGGFSTADAVNYPELFESNSNGTNGNRTYVPNTWQKISTSLTVPGSGLPYLETQSGGLGNDFGVNEFLVNAVNVVPATDIRGYGRNGSTDAGAFELGGVNLTTFINEFNQSLDKGFTYNAVSKTLTFINAKENVQIYNLNGVRLLNINNSTMLNVSEFMNGVYVLRITDKGKISNHKFVKR